MVPLAIKPHFDALKAKEKKYAHYISRAAFSGTRINLRQVSPESEAIYDFILGLHKACNGTLHLIAILSIVPTPVSSCTFRWAERALCLNWATNDDLSIQSALGSANEPQASGRSLDRTRPSQTTR